MFENKIRGLMEIWAATTTQRVFRGLIGRNLYKFMRRERNRQIAAATQIQRMIRGFLVPAWRVRGISFLVQLLIIFTRNAYITQTFTYITDSQVECYANSNTNA